MLLSLFWSALLVLLLLLLFWSALLVLELLLLPWSELLLLLLDELWVAVEFSLAAGPGFEV